LVIALLMSEVNKMVFKTANGKIKVGDRVKAQSGITGKVLGIDQDFVRVRVDTHPSITIISPYDEDELTVMQVMTQEIKNGA